MVASEAVLIYVRWTGDQNPTASRDPEGHPNSPFSVFVDVLFSF